MGVLYAFHSFQTYLARLRHSLGRRKAALEMKEEAQERPSRLRHTLVTLPYRVEESNPLSRAPKLGDAI
jgi:hypothetical protein